MNLSKLGYHILMVLSVVDGKYEKTEGEVIFDFLSRTYNKDFDLDKENKILHSLKKQDIAQHFINATRLFKENSSPKQRLELLTFAVDLVAVDNTITAEEEKILRSLSKNWGIDIEPILSARLD